MEWIRTCKLLYCLQFAVQREVANGGMEKNMETTLLVCSVGFKA